MNSKIIVLAAFCLICFSAFAQYTTPNDGVTYTLEDLVAESDGILTQDNGVYYLHEELIIAASDTLQIVEDGSLRIAPEVRITVSGVLSIDVPDNFTLDCSEEGEKFEGILVEQEAKLLWNKVTMQNGGGVRILTELTSSISNSEFYYNYGGVATGAVLSLSKGSHIIKNNTFIDNETPAIGSGANATASPRIDGNYIEANNQENSNRPQINMGPTGVATDTIKIVNNTIIGDRSKTRVGGISVSALIGGKINAIIYDNNIVDNRYGITIAGADVWAEIKKNIIEDNDTEGQPMLGGSGINLIATSADLYEVSITENQIRRNLWGITLQNQAKANLGEDESNPGNNVFSENENNGQVYALYNNTPNAIMAKYNCWIEDVAITLEDAEDVIFHNVDDASLGTVTFDPVSCAILGVEEVATSKVYLTPNPAKDLVVLHGVAHFETAVIYDVLGKEIKHYPIGSDTQQLELDLKAGVYFVRLQNNQQQITKKLLIK